MKKSILIFAALLCAATAAWAKSATAKLAATGAVPVSGIVNFEEVDGALKVTAELQGAPAGKHGFHIHENGACGNEGKDAGGHFNPDKAPHGLVTKDGFEHAHAGDLGNIEIGADGTGRMEATVKGLSLSEGARNVTGKAVILHEKEDDFGQPTGNAGGRIACGVIE